LSTKELNGKNLFSYSDNNPVMYSDPNGHFAQILAGALVGAAISAVGYIAELIADYGTKKAWNHFSARTLTWDMAKGAASGAIGFGIVDKLSKMGKFTSIGSTILSGHLAPAAYAISAFGDPFGISGFLENQALAYFGKWQNLTQTYITNTKSGGSSLW
jgi:hypothetical protein